MASFSVNPVAKSRRVPPQLVITILYIGCSFLPGFAARLGVVVLIAVGVAVDAVGVVLDAKKCGAGYVGGRDKQLQVAVAGIDSRNFLVVAVLGCGFVVIGDGGSGVGDKQVKALHGDSLSPRIAVRSAWFGLDCFQRFQPCGEGVHLGQYRVALAGIGCVVPCGGQLIDFVFQLPNLHAGGGVAVVEVAGDNSDSLHCGVLSPRLLPGGGGVVVVAIRIQFRRRIRC